MTTIHRLAFSNEEHLNNLLRLISPTVLFDLNLNSINSNVLLPDQIGNDGPNATAGQIMSKWLHTPTTGGRPKQLRCSYLTTSGTLEWINNFKQAFLRATISANYKIRLELYTSTKIELFKLVNEWAKETLTLTKDGDHEIHSFLSLWLLRRCPIVGTAPIHWEDGNSNNLNILYFGFNSDINCIGPLSPPAAAQSNA